jgi:hypothetical protein
MQFDLFADTPAPAAPPAPSKCRGNECDFFECEVCDTAKKSAHVCGECVSFKPTKFRRHLGIGFFCAESYDDARLDAPACETHFKLRVGPCENCGPVCEAWPCANADPKGSEKIEAVAAAKE